MLVLPPSPASSHLDVRAATALSPSLDCRPLIHRDNLNFIAKLNRVSSRLQRARKKTKHGDLLIGMAPISFDKHGIGTDKHYGLVFTEQMLAKVSLVNFYFFSAK